MFIATTEGGGMGFLSCCSDPQKQESKEKKSCCHPCLKCLGSLVNLIVLVFVWIATLYMLIVVVYAVVSPDPFGQDFRAVAEWVADGLDTVLQTLELGGLTTGAGPPAEALPVKPIYISIRSTGSMNDARAMQTELRRRRFYVRIVPYQNRYYIVLDGIPSIKLAQYYLRRLRQAGYRGRIVSEISG